MTSCAIDTVRRIGRYLKVPVSSLSYSTDKVITAVIDKQSVEGFASVILRLVQNDKTMATVETLLIYQWLEYIAQYADKLSSNAKLAENFLIDLNRTLENCSYVIGHQLTIADVAVYHVIYELLDRASITERAEWPHVCRWARHVQTRNDLRAGRDLLPFGSCCCTLAMSMNVAQMERKLKESIKMNK